MGRIKTSFIKNLGDDVFSRYKDRFTNDFNKNKEIIKEILDIKSKKLRNVLAGYITRLKERSK